MHFFFIIITVLFLLQFDDPLDPEADALINFHKKQVSHSSQAYWYLQGFHVSKQDNPIAIGKSLVDEYNQFNTASGNDFHPTEYPQERQLPRLNLFKSCKINIFNCLIESDLTTKEFKQLLNQNKILLDRYLRYFQFNDYKSVSLPSITEPFPEYGFLMDGNLLFIIKCLILVNTNATQKAINLIEDNIHQIKEELILADELLYKMVLISILANNLDALVYLAKIDPVFEIKDIQLLSKEELSLNKSFKRIFASSAIFWEQLDKNPKLITEDNYVPGWMSKTVFKKNMSINTTYKSYLTYLEISEVKQEDFANYIETSFSRIQEKRGNFSVLDKWRNSIGNILTGVAEPAYIEYFGRMFDINNKIALVNSVIKYRFETNNSTYIDLISASKNPYGDLKKPKLIEDKYLCFDGPLRDYKNHRCIRLAI